MRLAESSKRLKLTGARHRDIPSPANLEIDTGVPKVLKMSRSRTLAQIIMRFGCLIFALPLLPITPGAASSTLTDPGPRIDVLAPGFRATIARGGIVELRDARGTVFARDGGTDSAARVHWIGTEAAVAGGPDRVSISSGQRAQVTYDSPPGAGGHRIHQTCAVDAASGDLVIEQSARPPGSGAKPGTWGVSWAIGEIPEEFSIIVPSRSGIRLDADAPGDRHVFDYPMGWEAQLVIVEGKGRGFYVFADDPASRYKRLTVTRSSGGWLLQFATINDAPFDKLTECQSVRWRLNGYEGDWRVPARRYRDWMRENFKPETLADRRPAWAKDIRACVITGLSIPLIEELAKRLDPRQTLLYVPDWRGAGYDRNYPDYTAPRDAFGPFLDRAHELGFRVMPHVNYFGVDPLNPEYAAFQTFHVRSPWGKHDHEWWNWDRTDPPIKFAYINPASAKWRKRFVGAMAELCRRFPIDALHLDQTLCIYNDHNGRIDGMTMIEGNIALHRELRSALPDVAISGEGLNEVTCRHESFAQRHVWGLNHAEGTWNEAWLARAHPIASYLFLPHTIIYGYLGMAAPEADQLYAAWNAAYEHFGVIPTLRTGVDKLKHPSGFLRQFFDEAAFWQSARPAPDPDGPWADDVAFPFRTADGGRAARTIDGRLMGGERIISQTLSGLNRADTTASVPGWPVFDSRGLMGLDPRMRYPALPGPRDFTGPRVSVFPEGLIAEGALFAPEIAIVRTRAVSRVLLDAVAALRASGRGARWPDGSTTPLSSDNGGTFAPENDRIAAHPPYKGCPPGGESFARFRLSLPAGGKIHFTSRVVLGEGAAGEGRSDGVRFRVRAMADGKELAAERLQASEEPSALDLDLSSFGGKAVELELAVGSGPRNHASFDWARWIDPRIHSETSPRGELAITPAEGWALAIDSRGDAPIERRGESLRIGAHLPGSVFVFKSAPQAPPLPADLLTLRRHVVTGTRGAPITGAASRDVPVGPRACRGITRRSLFAHPPPNGITAVHIPVLLPRNAARFHSGIGLADGSKSQGVIFVVEINGCEIARRRMMPGPWQDIGADLARWAGKPAVLSLITDSDGGYEFDWALWGEPRITATQK